MMTSRRRNEIRRMEEPARPMIPTAGALKSAGDPSGLDTWACQAGAAPLPLDDMGSAGRRLAAIQSAVFLSRANDVMPIFTRQYWRLWLVAQILVSAPLYVLADNTATNDRKRDRQLVRQLQEQAKTRQDELMRKLPQQVHTEDAAINAVLENLYRECVVPKLFDPLPPGLPYKWFFPGGIYVGQWLWDTMFVVTAYAPLDDDAAIGQVFDNYWYTIDHNPQASKGSDRYGMVPNFLRNWPPVGYSQIPLLAWGCRMVERQTNDRRLIERCLPYLVAFDEWYSRERDTDGDGLIEYGAYQSVGKVGMEQTARYESFDLQPTTESMRLTVHPKRKTGGQWYGNREGVEQTCFLLMSERAIVAMARQLSQNDVADRYERTIAWRIKAMQQKMWDPKTRFFYSLDRDSDAIIPIRTIQAFFTLSCGAATPEQAAALVEQLKDPKQWWSSYPIPTVAMDDPTFKAQGYWQGDMWPATTYLVSVGLNHYGYHDLARDLTRRMLDLVSKHGINEHYDATAGKPLGISGLGMSCCLVSMIVQNIYGVQDDFRTIRIPAKAKGRRLLLGKLEVQYPQDHVVELRTGFEREFRVVFPDAPENLQVTVTCEGSNLPAEQMTVSKGAVNFNALAGKTYRVSREP